MRADAPDPCAPHASHEALPELVRRWFPSWTWRLPDHLAPGRRCAVVSSRLPRLLEPQGSWLKALRAVLREIRRRSGTLVAAPGTAGADFVIRGSERFNIPLMQVVSGNVRENPSEFQSSTGSLAGAPHYASSVEGTGPGVSSLDPHPDRELDEIQSVPWPDRATMAWADAVYVLRLRAGGNIERLLRRRLAEPGAEIYLVDRPDLQSTRVRAELLRFGAKLWKWEPAEPLMAVESNSMPSAKDAPNPRFISLPPVEHWDFLTHTTRACTGPWPHQPYVDYLDSLLDARADADHSALAALMRIISQRRLIASNRTIRGGYAVVSLTAVPLKDLSKLNVFRAHRARWDFEPYGICIRRLWLETRGARAVEYAGNSTWKSLSLNDRPFFQHVQRLDSAAGSTRTAGIDWSVEQEWRHVGDIDLAGLSHHDALIFVPTAAEARKVLEISPWPVTLVQ